MPQRMTKQTARLLAALLTDPRREWYGLELMDRADLRSGTAYPILHRLQGEGWLSSVREEIDPSSEGRPQRRLYRLTGVGQIEAQKALERHHCQGGTDRASAPILRPGSATA